MINDLPSFDSQPAERLDPMHLDLEDDELVSVIKDNIKSSIAYYDERGLKAKQEKNLQYYYGKQDLHKTSKKAKPYKENIIYEGMTRQKPIALSRMPDLTVKPGDDSPEAKRTARDLTGIFNSDVKKRTNRKLLGLAFKQEPIYYYAVIKAIWNPEKGDFGDYEFVNVHPDNIVFDHNCPNSDANNMRFVSERAKFTLKELIMQFPNKEEEIKREFGWDSETHEGKSDDMKMASPVNVWETWFHWYKMKKKESERIDGVVWMYGNLILKKMKNPYFDYQGRKKLFSKEMTERNAFSIDDLFNTLDPEEDSDKVYNNYFQDPEKPYFFMVYENMGEQPISETSRIEQILEFQDSINQDGAMIADMNLRSRGKDIFDTAAISSDTLSKMDIYDVDKAIAIDVPPNSSINNAHARIEQMPATQQMYKSMSDNRSKAFEMLGTGPATRGLTNANATLGQEQMSREGDFGLIDDIVEDTINACAEWQANWSMQFIKLFYTKTHMRHILGKDGEVLHTKLTQDMVDNGMEVVVSASGVDKQRRARLAQENMKLGIGDPLSYYEDTEQSSPKERALRAMMAQGSPQMYIQQYLMDKPPTPPGMPSSAVDAAMAASPGGDPNAAPPIPPTQAPMGGGNGMEWRWYPTPLRNMVQ